MVCEPGEDGVAGLMAVRVVVMLEIVNVVQQQRYAETFPAGPGQVSNWM